MTAILGSVTVEVEITHQEIAWTGNRGEPTTSLVEKGCVDMLCCCPLSFVSFLLSGV